MFSVGRNKSIVSFVKNVQQSLMQRETCAKDGSQYGLGFEQFGARYSERSLNVPFFIRQLPADFITCNFSDSFKIPTKPHTVCLNCLIPYLSDPVTEDRIMLTQIYRHR